MKMQKEQRICCISKWKNSINLFFNNYPKLKPGAKIIVPEKITKKNYCFK